MSETVLARYLATLVETLDTDYGVSAGALYRAAGVAPITGERVSYAVADALWAAAKGLADCTLGLKVGARVRYSSYSTLGHLLVTSKSVGDSLKAACELAFYVGAAGRLAISDVTGGCAITYEPVRADMKALYVRSEAVLLPMVRFARWASPGAVPDRVFLARSRPDDALAFEGAFGAPVTFGAGRHAVLWSTDILARPMTDANPALNEMLRQHVEAEMPHAVTLSGRIEDILAERLAKGVTPVLADTASFLGMSERSLQRGLSDEGTSFRDVLASARRAAAEKLLADGDMPVADIAARLGYSEPAAFVRAFSRWTGESPARWRRKK